MGRRRKERGNEGNEEGGIGKVGMIIMGIRSMLSRCIIQMRGGGKIDR